MKFGIIKFELHLHLKLIHYDLNEIEEPEKAYTKKLYFSLLILFAWNLFNMLVNIIVVC